ncbi:MAG: hypothetical protein AB1422_19410 [bacterium]
MIKIEALNTCLKTTQFPTFAELYSNNEIGRITDNTISPIDFFLILYSINVRP